jgi:DNA-binding response OmpR family regulator
MVKRILVVEDDEDSREMLKALLESKGFEVTTAENGLEGLEAAKAERPDIIVTNICMPKLDGVGLIEYIREQPEFDTVPIVVLSAVGSGDRSRAVKAGADQVMTKPVDPGALIVSMDKLFG